MTDPSKASDPLVEAGLRRFRELKTNPAEHDALLDQVEADTLRGIGNPELLTAREIELWAGSTPAASMLPRLVRRLILAGPSVTRATIRADEGVMTQGWDGLVESFAPSAFVPDGLSCWEIGTGGRPRTKAESDYATRSSNPLGIDPAEATFVFVTPRRWVGKEEWRQEKLAEKKWRDVRAYDVDDLEAWLEETPAVHVWFSELLGRDPRNAESVDNWWTSWSQMTRPATPASLILAGRDEVAERLRQALSSQANAVAIESGSVEEALAFLAAVLVAAPSEEAEQFLARSVIISSPAAWARAIVSGSPLILVANFAVSDIAPALRRNHQVVLLARPDDWGPEVETIALPPLGRREAQDALGESGFDWQNASALAALARRSLAAFRRRIGAGVPRRPPWAEAAIASRLVPLTLVGRWVSTSASDCASVAAICDRPYDEVERDLIAWSELDDKPVANVGGIWRLTSHEDAITYLHRFLTRDDLRRYADVATGVLAEIDPALELPAEKRYMAGALGRSRAWSETLREGLAETAALLGSRVGSERLADSTTGQEHADRLVWKLLTQAREDETGVVWYSIASVLPMLAEAAPDIFLSNLEETFSGHPAGASNFFTDDDRSSPLGAWSPHTHLLWALEALCWSPAYLGRAATALASLAETDPGGRLANRPIRSLHTVFLLPSPHTTAGPRERYEVIDALRSRKPSIAWSLLLLLIPRRVETWTSTHVPTWRDWALQKDEVVTVADLIHAIHEVVTRCLEEVGTDAGRWAQLIDRMEELPQEERTQVLETLERIDVSRWTAADLERVWAELRSVVRKHRRFPDAEWAMPSAELDELERQLIRLQPASAIAVAAPLFGHWPDLGGGNEDFETRERVLAAARVEAVRRILEESGFAGAIDLAKRVETSWFVGMAVADAVGDAYVADAIENSVGEDSRVATLARSYLSRLAGGDRDWGEALVTQWSDDDPAKAAVIALALPTDGRTFALVDGLDETIRASYWQEVQPFPASNDDAITAAEHLMDVRRFWSALRILTFDLHRERNNVDRRVLETAVTCLNRAAREEASEEPVGSIDYEVGELLDTLEGNGWDRGQVAAIEWAYMPVLQHSRPPRALHAALSTDPEFFVELVSLVYRAEGDEEAASGEAALKAEHAYEVLRTFRRAPGSDDAGNVDAQALQDWVADARSRLAAAGRAKVGDVVIGEVLSGSPSGMDGAWPHESTRDLIETIASKHLENGITVGKFNSRGVTMRDPYEGGKLERELAARYAGWAAQVAGRWPRTGAMLRGMAETYERDARREDAEADVLGDRG